MDDSHQFWVEKPEVLWGDWHFLPTQGLGDVELCNVMTRLVIVLSLLLFIVGFRQWWLFLILGILLFVVLWWVCTWSGSSRVVGSGAATRVEHYRCPGSSPPDVDPVGSGNSGDEILLLRRSTGPTTTTTGRGALPPLQLRPRQTR